MWWRVDGSENVLGGFVGTADWLPAAREGAKSTEQKEKKKSVAKPGPPRKENRTAAGVEDRWSDVEAIER